MRRRPFAAAAVVVLLLGCAEAEAPPARPPVAEPAVPSPEASCERTVLKNPLFGIADPAPLAEISRPIPHQIPGAGGPQAMWAWRSASEDPPRWERLEAPSAVYLSAGQALSQSGLGLPAGRWRLIVGAALGGDREAGLRMELDGDPGGPFEIEAEGAPTLHVAEIDLPKGADRLILTGHGPGEVKLIMACLVPID